LEFASEEKSTVDASKERTLAEMSKLVTELNQRIAAKKSQLEPIIEELRPLREEFREVQEKHDQLKKEYDATSAGLENETSRLQQVRPFESRVSGVFSMVLESHAEDTQK